jgi:hypothetical protein
MEKPHLIINIPIKNVRKVKQVLSGSRMSTLGGVRINREG